MLSYSIVFFSPDCLILNLDLTGDNAERPMMATARHEWIRRARSHLRRRAPRRHTIRQGTVAGRSWQPVNNDRDYNKLFSHIGFKTRLCEESDGVVVSITEGIVMKNVCTPCQDKWMCSTCDRCTMNVQQNPKKIVKHFCARYGFVVVWSLQSSKPWNKQRWSLVVSGMLEQRKNSAFCTMRTCILLRRLLANIRATSNAASSWTWRDAQRMSGMQRQNNKSIENFFNVLKSVCSDYKNVCIFIFI